MRTREELKQFLSENEIYLDFLGALETNGRTDNSCRKLFRRIYNPEDYIIGAFNWSLTIQGFDYWWKIHIKWLEHLKQTTK